MKKVLRVLALVLLTASTGFAQNGSVSGVITEMLNGQKSPVPFANVALIEKLQGTTTDINGSYTIENVEPGEYTMVVSFIGYKADTSKVVIVAGEAATVNRTMGQNSELLKEFRVEAKLNRESENILLMEQKNATEIKQQIGARELEKKGASDVASGLTKVTGITMVEGKSMFVRGLGDRYNLATWNNGLIASPNPDQKVVPLDLFPTDIVGNLAIDKVFSPRHFADFAGARIDIVSKDYPDEPMLKVELGTSFNTRTTFKNFEGRKLGDAEFFGFDGSARNLPIQIANVENNGYVSGQIEDDSYPYTTNLNNQRYLAGPTTTFGISGGNSYKVGTESLLGFFVSGNFGNKYQTKEGVDRVLKADRGIMTDYDFISHEYTTHTTLYGNLFYKFNDDHKLSFNTLFINSSENNATSHTGFNNDQSRDLVTSRNPYFQDQMTNYQLTGTHEFLKQDKLTVSWNTMYSSARNQEKDRNQLVWLLSDNNYYEYNTLDIASNHRWWSELTENQINANIDVVYKFKFISDDKDDSNQGRFYAGFDYLDKNRESDWRQVNYRIDRSDNNSPLVGEVNLQNPDGTLNEPNYTDGWYDFVEQKDPSSFYRGEMNIMAGYANVDYFLIPDKLQLFAGVRVAKSKQRIWYKELGDLYSDPLRANTLDTLNFFPTVGGRLATTKNTNLRFAFSQTMSRPMFREMAPIQYLPYFGGVQEQGNANLRNGYAYNGDVKYEWFPNRGEMIAVTVFGKYLFNPIERIRQEAATPLATYINTDKAMVAGVEFELTKNLGNIVKADSGWTRNFFVGFNASYLYSRISIDTTNTEQGSINVTNVNRQLQGASPILLNADLTYRLNVKKWNMKSDLTLSYNLSGRKITEAGVLGLPDTYEQPINTLNLILKNKIKEKFTVDVKVYNILDPTIKRVQEFTEATEIVNSYRLGTTFGIKLGYMF